MPQYNYIYLNVYGHFFIPLEHWIAAKLLGVIHYWRPQKMVNFLTYPLRLKVGNRPNQG